MITFITENQEPEKPPVFGDVCENQFFIDSHGWLCQKMSELSYNTIADEEGNPAADRAELLGWATRIRSILPKVSKIKF
jgi:hypothetical protein